MKKTVIFGPWIGELGTELTFWQCWIRHLRRERYSDCHCVVVGYPGRGVIYRDFCDEYWDLPLFFMDLITSGRYFTRWGTLVEPSTDQILEENHPVIQSIRQWMKEKADTLYPGASILNPILRLSPTVKDTNTEMFPRYDHQLIRSPLDVEISRPEKTLVVFPRARKNEPWRNWQADRWHILINRLLDNDYDIIIQGTSYDTLQIDIQHPNLINKIDVDLDTQIAYLQKSKLILSSCGGATRLAHVTGCPILIWGSRVYLDACHNAGDSAYYNPLNTPTYILARGDSWDYSVDEVFAAFQQAMKDIDAKQNS